MDITNQECEICLNNGVVTIPLIPCSHSRSFCQECIKLWLAEGRRTCPKCRELLPLQEYVSSAFPSYARTSSLSYTQLTFTGQAENTMGDMSITMEYNPALVHDPEPPHDLPLETRSCTLHHVCLVLFCISSIVITYLVLYLISRLF